MTDSTIEELLQQIASARYGREVREAIHDAILKCYEDGKADAGLKYKKTTIYRGDFTPNESKWLGISQLTDIPNDKIIGITYAVGPAAAGSILTRTLVTSTGYSCVASNQNNNNQTGVAIEATVFYKEV